MPELDAGMEELLKLLLPDDFDETETEEFADWDESRHPRHPKGDERGGEFAPGSKGDPRGGEFFHGTSGSALQSIIDKGIIPQNYSNWGGKPEGKVFLTFDKETAEAFAYTAAQQKGDTQFAVLRVIIPEDVPMTDRHIENTVTAVDRDWIQSYDLYEMTPDGKFERIKTVAVRKHAGRVAFVPVPAEEAKQYAEWDDEKHPRHPAGSAQGGEFAPAGGDDREILFLHDKEQKLNIPVESGVKAAPLAKTGFSNCTDCALNNYKSSKMDVYVGTAVRKDKLQEAKSELARLRSQYGREAVGPQAVVTEAFPHAWNVKDGKIVDASLGSREASQHIYYGFKVPPNELDKIKTGDELATWHLAHQYINTKHRPAGSPQGGEFAPKDNLELAAKVMNEYGLQRKGNAFLANMEPWLKGEDIGPCGAIASAAAKYLRQKGLDAKPFSAEYDTGTDWGGAPHYAVMVYQDKKPAFIVDLSVAQFDRKAPNLVFPTDPAWKKYMDIQEDDDAAFQSGPAALWTKDDIKLWKQRLKL